MSTQRLVTSQVGSNKKFIEMTRPLLSADYKDMAQSLLLLEMKSMESMGSVSKIIELQKQEILTELALRN